MPRWTTRFLWTILPLVGSAGSPTVAADILVRLDGTGHHRELAPALLAARDGDWLVLGPGEHVIHEPIRPRVVLRMRSEAGAERTAIRMEPLDPQNGSLLVLVKGSTDTGSPMVELTGLTLTGGRGQGKPAPLGGAIFSQDGLVLLNSCIIAGNSAAKGGGIHALKGVVTLRNCSFQGNSADQGGALFINDYAQVTVEDSSFTGNSAREGGALAITRYSSPTFKRCRISRNSATQGGGGMVNYDSNYPRLEDCEISWNRAPKGGGVLSRGSCYPYLVRSSIIGNSADEGGGIMTLDSSYPMVTNCLIAGNWARMGGGVMTRNTSYPYLMSSTISANVGGGLASADSSYPAVINSIVWGNSGGSLVGTMGSEHARPVFSCIEPPAPTGVQCVNRDPLFLKPGLRDQRGTPLDPSDDLWVEGDYRLHWSSPAIDSGAAQTSVHGGSGIEAPKEDRDGVPRPAWKGIDMGAFEYAGKTPPGPEFSFVFVSRSLGDVAPDSGEAVIRAHHGMLALGDLNGRFQVLLDPRSPDAPEDAPRDVLDPDVSFDGKRILFSGYSPRDAAFRIYEIHADGSGLRKVTRSDRIADLSRYGDAAERFQDYDDLDPCYLPDGRICFVSTRYPGSAPEGRRRATNLYLVNPDGTALRRITSERFGADTPSVDPTSGKIVFSRWWRTPELRSGSGLVNPEIPPEVPGQAPPVPPPAVPPGSPGYGNRVDVPPPTPERIDGEIPRPSTFRSEVIEGIPEGEFPGVNSWFLASMDPDGGHLAMFSGFHLDRTATQAYRPSFGRTGEPLALFLTSTPRFGLPGRFGLRRYRSGPRFPTMLGGPQTFDPEDKAAFHYQSAAALPDGRILVSAAPRDARGSGAFDIYIQDGPDPIRLLGDHEIAEMDAVPLIARPVPPAIADRVTAHLPETAPRTGEEARLEGGVFTFHVKNIFANAPVDAAIPNAPPAGEPLFIEFYMAPQRTSFLAADPPTLLRRLAIPRSGELEVELPAGVPLFEVLRRPDGSIPVGRDGQIFHVGGLNYGTPGTTATCVGCHAGHSMMEVPLDPLRTNLAPAASVTASSSRVQEGVTFRPAVLVDRRTDFFRSEWAAENLDPKPSVRLSWKAPVRASEVVIYRPRVGAGVFGLRNQIVRVTLNTFLEGAAQEARSYPARVEQAGTRYALDEGRPFDTLEVVLGPFSGKYEGGTGAALAEIEVIGRVSEIAAAGTPYLRGDVNTDARLGITDAVFAIDYLLFGKEDPPCMKGADANDDGAVGLSDAIALLGHLFLGGPAPPAPFGGCGADPTPDGLSCVAYWPCR